MQKDGHCRHKSLLAGGQSSRAYVTADALRAGHGRREGDSIHAFTPETPYRVAGHPVGSPLDEPAGQRRDRQERSKLERIRPLPDGHKTGRAVGAGSRGCGSNVMSIDVDNRNFTSLVGVLAAGMSRSGHIGGVFGLEGLPTTIHEVGSFRICARMARPRITVSVLRIADMESAEAAREAAAAADISRSASQPCRPDCHAIRNRRAAGHIRITPTAGDAHGGD